MRHYKFNANQIAACSGFTDLFVIGFSCPGQTIASTTAPNDYSQGFSNKSLILDQLDLGDLVYPVTYAENIAAVAGPSGSPTLSVGVTGTVTQFLQTWNPKTAGLITQPIASATTMGGASPTGALVSGEVNRVATPYVAAANINLVVDCQNGGGDGVAATAGETWIWMRIWRKNERIQLGSA